MLLSKPKPVSLHDQIHAVLVANDFFGEPLHCGYLPGLWINNPLACILVRENRYVSTADVCALIKWHEAGMRKLKGPITKVFFCAGQPTENSILLCDKYNIKLITTHENPLAYLELIEFLRKAQIK